MDKVQNNSDIKFYCYFAKQSIAFKKWNILEGEVFYIGLTKHVHRRKLEHARPSTKNDQELHKLLQDHPGKTGVGILNLILTTETKRTTIKFDKHQAHIIEQTLISIFNPKLNVYGNEKTREKTREKTKEKTREKN